MRKLDISSYQWINLGKRILFYKKWKLYQKVYYINWAQYICHDPNWNQSFPRSILQKQNTPFSRKMWIRFYKFRIKAEGEIWIILSHQGKIAWSFHIHSRGIFLSVKRPFHCWHWVGKHDLSYVHGIPSYLRHNVF